MKDGAAAPSLTAPYPAGAIAPRLLPTLLVFAAAVLAVVAFRAALPPALAIDEGSDYRDFYAPVARRIAAGLGPTDERGMPAVAYPPGYPKYPAGAVVGLPLLALLEPRFARRGWLALGVGAAALAGFLVGTPYAVLAPRAVLAGALFEGREKLGSASSATLAAQLVVAQGTVLATLALAGLALAAVRVRDWRHRLLIAWVVIGLLQRLLSPANFARYLIPALPPLALAAGLALEAITNAVQKRGRPLAAGAAVLLLGPAAGYALDIDALLMGPDVRDSAARWIERQVPAGRTIGVLGSLYFDTPPVNAERYRIVDVRDGAAPAVIVVPAARMALARRWSERERASPRRLEVVARFTQRPSPIWTWPVRSEPDDWAYTFPDVYVLASGADAGR